MTIRLFLAPFSVSLALRLFLPLRDSTYQNKSTNHMKENHISKPHPTIAKAQTLGSPFRFSYLVHFRLLTLAFSTRENMLFKATTGLHWLLLTYCKSAKIPCRHTVPVGTRRDLRPHACSTSTSLIGQQLVRVLSVDIQSNIFSLKLTWESFLMIIEQKPLFW